MPNWFALRPSSSRAVSAYAQPAGLLIVAMALLLNACGSNTPKQQSKDIPKSPPSMSAMQLLKMAVNSPERESLELQAVQVYLETGKLARARALLASIDGDTLKDDNFIKYIDLASGIALQDGANFLAHGILTKQRLEHQWQNMEPSAEISLREKRAQIFDLLGDSQLSVSERIQLTPLLASTKATQANQKALWQSLITIPLSELETLASNANNNMERGWYSLAVISKNNQIDLERQRAQLQAWKREWRNHPANQHLPDDLLLIQSLIEQRPQRIALLLPMNGKLAEASEAVRDGFFAAYYQAMNSGRTTPQISQYDTSLDAIEAYRQAVADGADLVIGPIDKEKVSELSLLPSLPVPLLTLNYADNPPPQPLSGLYQFGLAVEDEARQVARQAFLEGHRQAMLITPDQDWSLRSARAFSEEWERLGGIVVAHSEFNSASNFSGLVKTAMQIEQSQERARSLESFLGIELKSSPRSRGDVDMIFLLANPAQARQIKPTFAFHYAGNIPIYATSQVYSGEINAKADRDLNGIRFNAMPWLFEASKEKEAIALHSKSAAVYGRLHALGADAFRLYARLPQLAQVPQMRIYGATGSLKMLPDGSIEREQTWARFRNGLAQALPRVISQDEQEY